MPDQLHRPFTFRCGMSAKNRAVLAPLTNMQSPTDILSDDEFRWLEARANGGFSILTTCASHVVPEAKAWSGQFGNYADKHTPSLERLASLGRSTETHILPQLFHGGFRSPRSLTGVQPASASGFHIDTLGFERPRALEEDGIIQIKNAFVESALRCVNAGLSGVEIHGANGYLFTQFLSPFTNTRKDQWGGSLQNRARFLFETTSEVRRAIGTEAVLGVRLSPEDTKLIPQIDIDEMKEVATELHRLGVDYISLSLWDFRKISDKYKDRSAGQLVVEQFRKAIPSETALTVSGKIWNFTDANAAFDLGADFVALGSSAIANPNWPKLKTDDEVTRLPLTRAELGTRYVSDTFATYLKQWGYVKEEQ